MEYQSDKVEKLDNNKDLILLNLGDSESTILDKLFHSKLFNKLFNGDFKGSFSNGRHRCNFELKLNNKFYNIKSQLEIDGLYESDENIIITEMKREPNIVDFHLRQLYFPYKYIKSIVNNKKKIICLFINYNKKTDIIDIWNLKLNDNIINDVECIWHKQFKFNS